MLTFQATHPYTWDEGAGLSRRLGALPASINSNDTFTASQPSVRFGMANKLPKIPLGGALFGFFKNVIPPVLLLTCIAYCGRDACKKPLPETFLTISPADTTRESVYQKCWSVLSDFQRPFEPSPPILTNEKGVRRVPYVSGLADVVALLNTDPIRSKLTQLELADILIFLARYSPPRVVNVFDKNDNKFSGTMESIILPNLDQYFNASSTLPEAIKPLFKEFLEARAILNLATDEKKSNNDKKITCENLEFKIKLYLLLPTLNEKINQITPTTQSALYQWLNKYKDELPTEENMLTQSLISHLENSLAKENPDIRLVIHNNRTEMQRIIDDELSGNLIFWPQGLREYLQKEKRFTTQEIKELFGLGYYPVTGVNLHARLQETPGKEILPTQPTINVDSSNDTIPKNEVEPNADKGAEKPNLQKDTAVQPQPVERSEKKSKDKPKPKQPVVAAKTDRERPAAKAKTSASPAKPKVLTDADRVALIAGAFNKAIGKKTSGNFSVTVQSNWTRPEDNYVSAYSLFNAATQAGYQGNRNDFIALLKKNNNRKSSFKPDEQVILPVSAFKTTAAQAEKKKPRH